MAQVYIIKYLEILQWMGKGLRPFNPKGNISDGQCLPSSNTSRRYQVLAPLAQPPLVQSSKNVDRYRSVVSIEITETAHHCIKRNSLGGSRNVWMEDNNADHQVLFQGYGPVDGPNKPRSSIWSKLGGLTVPILRITTLTTHWGLRHSYKFRWLAESKPATNQIWWVIFKGFSPTKQPDTSDYLTTITDLFRELRRPMTAKWIKSHQDRLTPDNK